MTTTNMDHVSMVVTYEMRQGLGVLSTMATGRISVRKTALIRVQGHNVKAGTVDKPPVLEPQIKTSAVPRRTIGIQILREATSDLALVLEGHQLSTKPRLNEVVKEGGNNFRLDMLCLHDSSADIVTSLASE